MMSQRFRIVGRLDIVQCEDKLWLPFVRIWCVRASDSFLSCVAACWLVETESNTQGGLEEAEGMHQVGWPFCLIVLPG